MELWENEPLILPFGPTASRVDALGAQAELQLSNTLWVEGHSGFLSCTRRRAGYLVIRTLSKSTFTIWFYSASGQTTSVVFSILDTSRHGPLLIQVRMERFYIFKNQCWVIVFP